MDPRNAPPQDGPSTTDNTAPPPRRRLSMEEDYFYQEVMTTPRRSSQPPPYQRVSSRPSVSRHMNGTGRGEELATGGGDITNDTMENDDESLPEYKSSIWLEGIFSRKHEIENTTKRAEDRQWHTSYVTLNGTALNVYRAKKNWGLGRTRDDGPSVNPDNPPWMGRGKLEKSYSLLHADAGIAADYKKRRYVIRIRAETDQFLLSCVELSTFVKWLEGLFAAIDVAAPIDDRDFPRDMSIPRIQRIRWFRGHSPTQTTVDLTEVELPNPPQEVSAPEAADQQVSTSPVNTLENQTRVEPEPEVPGDEGEESVQPPPRSRDPFHRLSTTSYPNLAIDPHSGKWFPEHCWSSAHDMLYAKLCYSNLLFRSPRKSNFIISKGKQWFVDWTTGRMVRVLPPAYGDIEWFGPWQVIHTENRRI